MLIYALALQIADNSVKTFIFGFGILGKHNTALANFLANVIINNFDKIFLYIHLVLIEVIIKAKIVFNLSSI